MQTLLHPRLAVFKALPFVQAGTAHNMPFSANLVSTVKQSFLIVRFPLTPPRDHYAIRYLDAGHALEAGLLLILESGRHPC
jgi:hypothetical protein